jgi:hypothetical protein
LERWGVPSGGDWSCYHGAALDIHGAERVNISDNAFRRLDNNAIILSGYTRHVTIRHNTASWLGQNFVVSWGDTDGFDGTAGTQPRFSTVESNLVREIGNYEKQSSFYFQAKSCQNDIVGNVVFNGRESSSALCFYALCFVLCSPPTFPSLCCARSSGND